MNRASERSERGYTLIEILVGLAIVSLLFSFGYVSFRDFSRRQALSGSLKQIQGDLRLAQSSAAAGDKPDDCDLGILDSYSFKVNSSNEYEIDANCTIADISTVIISKTVAVAPGVSVSISSNPINFKILGQGTNIASGTNITITISQSGTNNQSIITVTPGGEIK